MHVIKLQSRKCFVKKNRKRVRKKCLRIIQIYTESYLKIALVSLNGNDQWTFYGKPYKQRAPNWTKSKAMFPLMVSNIVQAERESL